MTTHGHELRGGGNAGGLGVAGRRRDKREKTIGTTVIAESIKYT